MIHPPWIEWSHHFHRAYRIGQDKPVFVHKLLCQDTVEERIHKLQQEKAKLGEGTRSGHCQVMLREVST